MEYINLGGSALKVSRFGFGCCPMGGHGWGKVSEDEFEGAVFAALDNGVTLFDTADIYGFGRSEELLGKFLKRHRKEAVIATKFGVRTDEQGVTYYDNSAAWIDKALEGSLARLGVDCIDLYQVHNLDGKTSLVDINAVLEKKRKEGKIRYYGLSNVSRAVVDIVSLPKECVSFQEEYSLANRDKEKEIDTICAGKSLSFMSWGSLGQGILSGKYGADAVFNPDDRRSRPIYANFHGEKLLKNIAMIKSVREHFLASGKTISQIAIRWILDRFDRSVALVGIKRRAQIMENIEAFGWQLSSEDLTRLDSLSR